MKLQQIRCFCEVVDHGCSVSKAATALHTSQPGVSRQIQLLEEDLHTVLLDRRNTRIAGLTDAGRALVPTMRRLLVEADNLRRQAHELATSGKTRFIISTSHTYARHTLLSVLKQFIQRHPNVAIQMRESAAPRIMQLLAAGEVDIGVATEPVDQLPGITRMPCYRISNSLIAPPGHPLLKHRRVTLQQIQQYPLITYDERHHLGRVVRERFKREGLEPNIVISIIDDDVMKAYVEAGFGIAVLPSVAYSSSKDKLLRAISVDHLFEAGTCVVMTPEGRHMQEHVRDFIDIVKATPVAGVGAPRR
ncbi:MAG: LysR family transcriptional regulator [Burkholderiales bacterium]|nr:LysR family transcriptional regulator [Burkholderiales bacterium]